MNQDVDERVGAVHVELLHGLLVDLPIHLRSDNMGTGWNLLLVGSHVKHEQHHANS